MACALTQGYNLDCRDSHGGLKEVYILELANIESITSAAGIITDITKAASKVFFKYNLVAFTGEANEAGTFSRENGSASFKQTVTFPINKMTVAVRNELLLLAKNRLAMVIVDENGLAWLYGKEKGMMITALNAKTGVQLADRNGYELTFESDEKELALNVNDATLASLTVAEA